MNEDNRIETTMNITLDLGNRYDTGGKRGETDVQISKAVFITKSLFSVLKLAAVGSETNGVESEFAEQVQNIVILGDALQTGIVEALDQLRIHEREQSEDVLSSNLVGE